MSLAPGTRLGPCEILAPLGAGGMGEVYRALDTRLNRHVAIKVLPEAYASDPERIARFHREAQAVAALNHANIAAIYELAEADPAAGAGTGAVKYLVLELVEGETLADRLRRGPLPVTEALHVARQILEALEAAHEKGICHRDLKPANIKLSVRGAAPAPAADGRPDRSERRPSAGEVADYSVKVLDFGLAKFLQTGPTPANLTHSPTLSLAGTLPGMILGTAAYMSPEQAKGFEADQRSDLFSFGCILYDLLTGRPAFDGDTASEILAAVLKSDVDWTALPPRLNPRLVDLLRRCLEKNPKQRWHAAADVRVEIESVVDRPIVADAPPLAAPAPRPLWKQALPLAAVAILAAGLAGYAAWALKPPPAAAVTRFTIALPDNSAFTNIGRRLVDVSPDGTTLAYLADRRLHVRDLDALELRIVAGDGATDLYNPAFSPDGRSIAFVIGGVPPIQLQRVAVTGGAPVTLAGVGTIFGMRWDEHGIVIGQGANGIVRVAPEGGAPEVIASAGPDEMLGTPQILPGGRTLLYSVKKTDDTWNAAQIAVQPIGGGERRVLVNGGTDGRYLPTGHLVYLLNGVLLAVPFDVDRLALDGSPVPVIEDVFGRPTAAAGGSGSAHLGVSAAGTLVYVPGPGGDEAAALALFDRKGDAQVLNVPPAEYRSPRVSPDGRFVAVETGSANETFVAVYELSGASALRRLTFGGNNRAPVWSPDGQWIACQSDRDGDLAVYRQRADGSGAAERLSTPEPNTEHIPEDWSPDGRRLLVTVRQDQQYMLMTMMLEDGTMEPFADARSTAMLNAAFAPDGRWIAYQGRIDARGAVYVQPFPSTGAKYLLPVPSGGHPTWSPKGDELVVNSGPTSSTIVSVRTTPSFTFGPPQAFPRAGRSEANPAAARANIDFLPDGERLVGVAPGGGVDATPSGLIVVLNWLDELKRRVPAR